MNLEKGRVEEKSSLNISNLLRKKGSEILHLIKISRKVIGVSILLIIPSGIKVQSAEGVFSQKDITNTLKTDTLSLIFNKDNENNKDNKDKIVSVNEDTTSIQFILSPAALNTDTISQVMFWKFIQTLEEDSVVINVFETRERLKTVHKEEWDDSTKTGKAKKQYLGNIKEDNGVDKNATIYSTSGKKDFYNFDAVEGMISQSIPIFIEQGVDPWYCQAILLIESPGRLDVESYAKAMGPFQLIPCTARKMGLTVNDAIDERTDLLKSAAAAAKYIKEVCIVEAKQRLNTLRIKYDENSMEFKLLVMHYYNAGKGNVNGAVSKVKSNRFTNLDMSFIEELWHTEHNNFRNASQNYSQSILAAFLNFYEMIQEKYEGKSFIVTEYKDLPENKELQERLENLKIAFKADTDSVGIDTISIKKIVETEQYKKFDNIKHNKQPSVY